MMKLNEQQRDAVRCPVNACVSACPGSGKTRTIVAKLLRCIEEIRDSPRRIACITYTHAAVDEIEMRLREYGAIGDDDYCEISTIHSFCLSNILQPFHYRLPELKHGFQVIPPDSDDWHALVGQIANRHGITARWIEGFANVHRRPDGSVFVPSGIGDGAAAELLDYLDANGLVTFPDIVYHSCRLVRVLPFIARGLSSRFAWILVDEFQDTSDGQVAILAAVGQQRRTRLFLVGDPNQSIMAFAGADPNLMESFSGEIGARADLRLPGNYRCSELIVNCAERLIPTDPGMQAVGEWRDFAVAPQYIHVDDRSASIFEHYLPTLEQLRIPIGKAAVLAPWWLPLYHLSRDLRAAGVPVIGPGARPYRRTRLFAGLAEHLCAYSEDRSPGLFRSLQRTLFIMLLNLTGVPNWKVFSYDGRRCLCDLATQTRQMGLESNDQAIEWLPLAAERITASLHRYELLPTDYSSALHDSVEDMLQDMLRNGIDMDSLSISNLGVFARPRDCLQLITMHSSKGREFDAVAIIDLHDGRVPHFSWQTMDEYEEARRQLYVAITRARKLLMLFTDSSDSRNEPSPFLRDLGLGSS